MLKKLVVNLLPWILSGLMLFIGVFILIQPMRASEGMWRIFDDVHTVRTQEMVYELQQGQFPVRLLSRLGNGGGYLLFNFYSPFAYYLTAGLVFLGTSALNASKLMFQLAYVLAAVGMFGFLKTKFPKDWVIPVVGALVLISSPYFNYDAYTRGALGELLGFALIPWVFLSYELLKTTKQWFWSFVMAGIVSLQLYTHAISAFITMPFLLLFVGFDFWASLLKKSHLWQLASAGLLTFGLSGTYFLPMWFEKSGVQYSQVAFVASGYKSGFLKIGELLGFDRAADLSIKPMTLGLTLVGVAVVSWLVLLIQKKHRGLAGFFGLGLVLCLIVLTPASEWLWQSNAVLQMAQFPYRYLIITTFLVVWLCMSGLQSFKTPILKNSLAVVMLILSFWLNREFAQVSDYYFVGEFKAEDPCATTTWQAEYLPTTTQLCLTSSNPSKLATASGALAVVTAESTRGGTAAEISTNGQPGTLFIGKYFYPGWQLTSNQNLKTLKPFGSEGILSTEVVEGETQFYLVFQDTLVKKIGNWLTLVTGVIMLLGLLRFWPWKFSKTVPQQ